MLEMVKMLVVLDVLEMDKNIALMDGLIMSQQLVEQLNLEHVVIL
jgi:hypothetical protein